MTEMETHTQYEFVHFQSSELCMIHILNNRDLSISYLCCGGRGFAIPRTNSPRRSIHTSTRSDIDLPIPVQGTCDICFSDDVKLYSTCSTCSQPFCKPCLDKITTMACPYCRGKLKNNFWG